MMSHRMGKLLLALTLVFLAWMAISAFSHGEEGDPIAVVEPESSLPSLDGQPPSAKSIHEGHSPPPTFPGMPVHHKIDGEKPLQVDGFGRSLLTWDALAATSLGKEFQYPRCLQEVNGREAAIVGYMCPLEQVGEMDEFLLIEIPVGCFYCQPISPTGIVLVQMAAGKKEPLRYEPVKVTGRLALNAGDPEDFLYVLSDAKLSGAN